MSVRVNRAELLNSLSLVQYGLSVRDYLAQSSCFVFQDGAVASFNDEIFCRAKTGLPPEIAGAVKATQLMRALEAVPDDEVEVSATAKEFRVRGRHDKFGVKLEAEILLPVDQVESPSKWTPLPEDFASAVAKVCAAAGTNNEEFLTVCAHLHPDYMEASDRKQITRYDIDTGVSRPILVRAKSLENAAKLQLTKAGQTDNWFHLRNKVLVYSCRVHAGADAYPTDAITQAMDFRGVPTVLPKGAALGAKLGEVFSGEDKDNNKVGVRLTDGRMEVRGEGSSGWGSKDLETTYKGEPVSFRISPAMLTQIVTEHQECELAPGKLIVHGDHWRYMTVLSEADPVQASDSADGAAPDAEPEPDDAPADEYQETNY